MTRIDQLAGELTGIIRGSVQQGAPLAPMTTYGVGGPASLLVTAQCAQDVVATVRHAARLDVPLIVIGGGSNLLVSDDGYRGATLVLSGDLSGLDVSESRIVAGGGCRFSSVVKAAEAHALTGLEFGAGIPGTLGGAVAMNAGSRTEWIGPLVESVDVVSLVEADAKPTTLYGPDIEWGYRSSSLRGRYVVLSATLALTPGDSTAISAEMSRLSERRRATQPLAQRNAGSVFRNPEGMSAGQLIEAAGLKGVRHGGAAISDVHANFIVTEQGASAADVHALVELARERVLEASGVRLETEIQVIGPFREG